MEQILSQCSKGSQGPLALPSSDLRPLAVVSVVNHPTVRSCQNGLAHQYTLCVLKAGYNSFYSLWGSIFSCLMQKNHFNIILLFFPYNKAVFECFKCISNMWVFLSILTSLTRFNKNVCYKEKIILTSQIEEAQINSFFFQSNPCFSLTCFSHNKHCLQRNS